ncbi:PfkB family carbohydrate kinase [Pseudoxanthobacter sp.]|uniref:PfkB family carbohydrate kinase n=1 Tax=Pseudoxanthobacter sp. TaxID=1925742 RepID=UPI002FE3D810
MRVFVVGNVALDETLLLADWPRPGASVFGRALSSDLGGKGANQAVAMARAGLDVSLTAAVGCDGRAQTLRGRLASEAVGARLIGRPDLATDTSLVMTCGAENMIVTTVACAESVTPAEAAAALDEARPGDLAVLQGNLTEAATAAVLEAARARGIVSAFNPSPLRPAFAGLAGRAGIVFVNAGEAEALTGRTGAAAAAALAARGAGTVVLTLGAEGALLVTGGAAGARFVPAVPAQAADTTGAGDCFMATVLASALRRGGQPDEQALRHGAMAAAIAVSRPGTCAAFPDAATMAAILATP